jgi:hypothetical protein
MLPPENETFEILRDARLFARWIRQGAMTVEQAKKDLLPTPAQWEMIRDDHHAHVLADVLWRRKQTWTAVVRLLVAGRRRKFVVANVSPS